MNNYDLLRITAIIGVFIRLPDAMAAERDALAKLVSSLYYDEEIEPTDALEQWCSLADPKLVERVLKATRSDQMALEIATEVREIAWMDAPYSVLDDMYRLQNADIQEAFSENTQWHCLLIAYTFQEMCAKVTC